MTGAWRILRREYHAYLCTPWFYGIGAAFLALTGLTFFIVADGTREADLRFWFPNLTFVLLATVPVVTSRTLAEERRTRHLEALLARPISPFGLVLGKWLAVSALFVAFLIPTLVYVALIAAWGDPDWAPLITAYGGTILIVALFAAIGTLTSAVTATAAAAGVGGFAVLVTLQLADAVPAVRAFSFVEPFDNFVRGVPRLRDFVYFGTGTLFCLLMAASWQTMKRTADRLRRAGAPAALAAATAVAANSAVIPVDMAFDVTAIGRYSLSPASRDVLTNIERPVHITAFEPANTTAARNTRKLLEQFEDAEPKIRYRIMDRRRYQAEAARLGVTEEGQAAVEVGERREVVDPVTELGITSSLQRLTRSRRQTLCAITGHGERLFDDTGPFGFDGARRAIELNGVAVESIDLTVSPTIPPHCTILGLFAPVVALRDPEMQALRTYLEANGKMLVLGEPDGANVEPLTSLLGLRFLPGFVVDPERSVAGDPRAVLINDFPTQSPVVRDVPGMFVLNAGGITTVSSEDQGLTVAKVMQSSQPSWLELNPQEGRYQPELGDRGGPVVMAGGADRSRLQGSGEQRVGSGGATIDRARLLLVADADWMSNGFLDELGNRKFLGNAINWLAGEEDLVAVGGEEADLRRLTLTPARRVTMGWVSMGGLPGLAVLTGVVVWWSRRRSTANAENTLAVRK